MSKSGAEKKIINNWRNTNYGVVDKKQSSLVANPFLTSSLQVEMTNYISPEDEI